MSTFVKRFFRFKGADKGIYICLFIMCVFGILMVWSAANGSVPKYGTISAFKKTAQQGLYMFGGAIAMTVFAKTFKANRINWRIMRTVFIANWVMMLMCRLFTPVNGAYAWIRLPAGFTIQPGEFMKITLIISVAFCVTVVYDSFEVRPRFHSSEEKQQFFKDRLIRSLAIPLVLIAVAFLTGVAINDDLGSSLILGLIALIVFMYAPGKLYRNYKKMAIIGIAALGVLAFFMGKYVLDSYQIKRFTIMLNPLSDPTDSGYQLVNSLIAIVNGGLSGLGLDNSTQKFGYIPEAYNDFIGAIIMEEFGIAGLLLVLLPFTYIIVVLLVYGAKVKSNLESLILIGISTYFFAHLLVNLGGITGLIPMTGVPLLFISYGGSSILTAFIAVGISQAIIAKYNKERLSGTKNR